MNRKSNRVLVVEDSPVGQKALSSVIQSLGFESDIVVNSEQAVVNATLNNYCLILMDLRLPDRDGFKTAQTIRSNGNNVPIVAVSAYPLAMDWCQCVEAGIDDSIGKGFRRDEIERVITLWGSADLGHPA